MGLLQLLGVILTFLGMAISLSILTLFGFGVIIGIPLIVVGLTMLFVPDFYIFSMLVMVITLIIGSLFGLSSFEGYLLISLVVFALLGLMYQSKLRQVALDYKNCPYCGETVRSVAVKCRYCQSTLK